MSEVQGSQHNLTCLVDQRVDKKKSILTETGKKESDTRTVIDKGKLGNGVKFCSQDAKI